jgi:hypothetical protein
MIPVTANGWNTVLDDAGLVLDGELADALEATRAAARSEDPVVIRTATRKLAYATARVVTDLRFIEAFQPSRDGRTARAKAAIHEIAKDAIEAVVKGDGSDHEQRRQALFELVASMARTPEVVDDRLAAVFGAKRADLVDSQ